MRNSARSLWLPLVAAVLSLSPAPAAFAITIDWVTVGNPGNAADDTGFGSVADVYRIARTEVTNSQYADFLNAAAATDTNGLYNTNMGSHAAGGIARSGGPGTFTYSAKPGRENMPVNFVSFYDALRFVNWLHNGQGSGDTETGAYTITPEGISNNSITRNAGATIFLPSEDEWYKAAYYDANDTSVLSDYFDYPAGSDAQTTCAAPTATGNRANCLGNGVANFTDVGSYTGSASPYGTFDQGGNAWEWNEAISGTFRGLRGGSFNNSAITLAASDRNLVAPTNEIFHWGFRVASPIPEPGTGLLVMAGLLGLAGGRRRRA